MPHSLPLIFCFILSFQNPSLSFVQKRFIVNHLKSSTQNFEASHLPANLIEGLTTNDLMNIEVKPENAELLDKVGARLPYMLPSQQHGVFLRFVLINITKAWSYPLNFAALCGVIA